MANQPDHREHLAPRRPTCSRSAGWPSRRSCHVYSGTVGHLRVARKFAGFELRAVLSSGARDLTLCPRRQRQPKTAGSCPFEISLLKLAWLQRKQSEAGKREQRTVSPEARRLFTPRTHHDALEFPDGKMVLPADLWESQEATVLQLPAQPVTATEIKAQEPVPHFG
jgi:hypothetical protein